jgi:hypothetical protein
MLTSVVKFYIGIPIVISKINIAIYKKQVGKLGSFSI